MITMLLGGLWHGAAWTFVLWGAMHGVGLVGEHLFSGRLRLPAWLRWLMTFNFVVVGWVLFRSRSVSAAATFLSRLAVPGPATLLSPAILVAVLVVVGLQLAPPQPVQVLQGLVDRARPALLGVGLAVVIVFVGATVSSQGVPPFIYFRF